MTHTRLPLFLVVMLWVVTLVHSPHAQAGPRDFASDGPQESRTELQVWTDEARGRAIPVKLYIPDADGPMPVVIFSHGLGGTREAAPYLGERWASWGILGVFIQHPGSDAEVWRGERGRPAIMDALREAAADPQTAIDRFSDVPFVVSRIVALAGDGALPADPERIGIAGHSFGAHTTMAAAGRRYPNAPGATFRDERIRAGVLLSPPPITETDEARLSAIFSRIDIPLMHLTGTEDDSPINADQKPHHRLVPYARIDAAPQYLVVFDGGDHSVFSGRERRFRSDPDWYPEVQNATAALSTAFFLAHLDADDDARTWLTGGGARAVLREGDRYEHKAP